MCVIVYLYYVFVKQLKTHLRENLCVEDQVIAAYSPMGVGQLCLESFVYALVMRFLPSLFFTNNLVNYDLEKVAQQVTKKQYDSNVAPLTLLPKKLRQHVFCFVVCRSCHSSTHQNTDA
jgi:hypothetical protein